MNTTPFNEEQNQESSNIHQEINQEVNNDLSSNSASETPEGNEEETLALPPKDEIISSEPQKTEPDAEIAPEPTEETHESKKEKAPAIQWDDVNFEGKEYCSLNEKNEIILNATTLSKERVLKVINIHNYETTAPDLVKVFNEVNTKVEDLNNEWEQNEDKLKLVGKVMRLKEYILHANAIGNFEPLLKNIDEKEQAINAIYSENVNIKTALVEKANALKDSEEWHKTTDAFKEIINEWKLAPAIPKTQSDDLWQEIENARNHFYERKQAHHETIEKEMMQNLDWKLELCEQAEALQNSEEWRKTSDKMKELMDKWKTIGRVSSVEKNDELWARFNTARNTFFDKKKVHYGEIQEEQEANYQLKCELVEQAEKLQDSTEWNMTSNELAELMKKWKKIGRVPADKSDELWNRLQTAMDKFYTNKRQYTEEVKIELEDNYAQKLALVKRAEQIQDSMEWRETTEELNELMDEWKKIGPIARAQSNALWEQFIKARHHFFNRKDADRDKRKARFQSQVQSRLQQTKDFLNKIKDELKEDEERLEDFKKSLAETTGTSHKDDELRNHLQSLIKQIEKKLPNKQEKVKEVEVQFADLEKKSKEKLQKNSDEK